MDDTHDELIAELRRSVLALFEYTKTHAFLIPIPGTTPPLFISAGEMVQLRDMSEPIVLAGDAANDPVW